jgi:hypothetical protein
MDWLSPFLFGACAGLAAGILIHWRELVNTRKARQKYNDAVARMSKRGRT